MLALLLASVMALPAVALAKAGPSVASASSAAPRASRLAHRNAEAASGAEAAPAAQVAQDAPRVLLDQSPRAVEYQLARLTTDQLTRVERLDTDVKYRPIYVALLTRKGMARPLRDEALAAIVKMDRAAPTRVLLDALAKVPADEADGPNGDSLLAILLGQPADVLKQQRDTLARSAADAAEPASAEATAGRPLVRRGAYGGLMIADADPAPAWQAAAARDGHLVELLRSVPHLGKSEPLRAALFTPVAAVLAETKDPRTRLAAVTALAWTRRDSATFDLLAREILSIGDPDVRAAAISAVQLIPEPAWSRATIDPLARAIVTLVKATAAERRTEPPTIDALQLGEKLAALLPADARLAVRRDLRALGVQVVRIEAVPEQMIFDVKWFVVQAGKPVQLVLANPDAMQHNLVISEPGSLQEVGTKGSMMPLPTDPDAKPYVPDTPLVLAATRLLNGGETDRLNFTAPAKPGEYPYLCTFPGHWIRMYGVMLVVENLEAWEAKPTVPSDPVTGKPFAKQRN